MIHKDTKELPRRVRFTLRAAPWKEHTQYNGWWIFLPALVFFLLSILVPKIYAKVPMLPSSILALPPGGHAVVVDKSQQRLTLITRSSDTTMIGKDVICTTGENSGNKEKSGDKRTPEGVYFCRSLLIPPKLPLKYGPCALPLNYPNPIDRALHRGGQGIWIHGIHENRLTQNTQGCVVLQNRDLVYLARHVRPLITPIVIEDEVHEIPETNLARQAERVLKFLECWRTAYVMGDLGTYLSCYSPSFSGNESSPAQWRQHKSTLFGRYHHHHMCVDIGPPTLLHTAAYDLISFEESFEGGRLHVRGFKRLYLEKKEDKIFIIAEEWIPRETAVKAETAFWKTLARVLTPKDNYRIIAVVHSVPFTARQSNKGFTGKGVTKDPASCP